MNVLFVLDTMGKKPASLGEPCELLSYETFLDIVIEEKLRYLAFPQTLPKRFIHLALTRLFGSSRSPSGSTGQSLRATSVWVSWCSVPVSGVDILDDLTELNQTRTDFVQRSAAAKTGLETFLKLKKKPR